MEKARKKYKLSAPQILVLGVITSILIGAVLLKLPISNNGKSISFIDSLFTSTSAVCVTGLNTIIPSDQFTLFGKIVLMCLIELGGIGFMSFIALLLMILKKKIGLSERNLIKESLNQNNNKGILKLIKKVFLYLGTIEIIGAILLSITFIPDYGVKRGIFYSIFHSISLVCNAGFDILGNESFAQYQYNGFFCIVSMLLIIVGGLGYTVLSDIIDLIKKIFKNKISISKAIKELTTNTKLVLVTTLILLISGTVLTFILEKNNVQIMGNDNIGQKILKSSFYSTTLRTAGFETVSTDSLSIATKFISIIYMFIGGSSGSTAGGIKTTTIAIVILTIISYLKGEENTVVFKRKIPYKILKRAIVIVIVSVMIIITAIVGLSITEMQKKDEINTNTELTNSEDYFLDIVFEAFSAFSTTGLSTGLTKQLSVYGKLIIIFLMFVGRLGPITISYAILRQEKDKKKIGYAECDLLVG